eukprot:COSAG06_NODE_29136_length_562_cov_0.749460_1_plen_187_part_11
MVDCTIASSLYTLGATLVFVKSTDTITTLNERMAANIMSTLDDAILAVDKDDREYCVDLFAAICDAGVGTSPAELNRARDALSERAGMQRTDYDTIERQCRQAKSSRTVDVCDVVTYTTIGLELLIAALLRACASDPVNVLDMRGSGLCNGISRTAWRMFWTAISQLAIGTLKIAGLNDTAIELLVE